jgi:hypothetical protein
MITKLPNNNSLTSSGTRILADLKISNQVNKINVYKILQNLTVFDSI